MTYHANTTQDKGILILDKVDFMLRSIGTSLVRSG